MSSRNRRRLGRALLLATVASLPLAFADEPPIKAPDDFEKKFTSLAHELSEKHVSLAKKLDDSDHKAEGFRERLLALTLAPDSATGRARLGYKKDGAAWRGAPGRPPADAKPLDAKLTSEREALRRSASTRLLELAKRARAGGLEDDARRVAGLALEEAPELAGARALLGHTNGTAASPASATPNAGAPATPNAREKSGPIWTSPRETRIGAAFTAAREKAKPAHPGKPDADDAAFGSAIALPGATLATTQHGSLFTSTASKCENADALASTLEVSWQALRFYLGGEALGFELPGARASGTPLAIGRIRAVVVAKAEYDPLVDRLVSSKDSAAFFKTCTGFHDRASLPSGPAWVAGSDESAAARAESLACLVVDIHMDATLPANAPSPDFVLEGLRRFVAGHASGDANMLYAKPGSSSRRVFDGGTFGEFRATVRDVLALSLEGDLRALLQRGQNDLERADAAVAYAFVDWALEVKRGELVAFLAGLKSGETAPATFERAFKMTVEEAERALRAWAREEY